MKTIHAILTSALTLVVSQGVALGGPRLPRHALASGHEPGVAGEGLGPTAGGWLWAPGYPTLIAAHEDAIYLERQLWPRADRLKPHKPVRSFVDARKRLGLPVHDGYPRLAHIRRALLAATAPRFLKSEGHPIYLEACLNRLEQSLQQVR